MRDKNIGFIGLGNVGSKIAYNILQNKNYSLYVFDLNKKTSKKLVSEGAILCNSIKKPVFNTLPNKSFIFNMDELSNKLKAPSIDYASIVFLKNDPNELFIAMNELAYHISSESLNTV